MGRVPDRVLTALVGSSLMFLVDGTVIESDAGEAAAAALSRFVREQLSVDWCAREFVIWDGRVGSSAMVSLESLLSRSRISIGEKFF
jgi:hypothetical protein